MPRPRLRMGVGATVDVLISKLHPKNVISKAYPNYTKNDKATGLIVLSQGPQQIRRQEKNVIIFRHDICGDQETPFVDDQNGKRHSPISLEVVWGRKWWPNRVFAFLLVVMEVNVKLAMTYFLGQEVTGQIAFRSKLAHTLIHNDEEDMSPVIRSKRQ